MTSKKRYMLWTIIMIAFCSRIISVAQTDTTDQCPPIITEAISLASESCDDLGRNSACYGHNQVIASFTDEAQAEDFAQPADTAQLANIMTISTSALNVDESLWGLALMNVQANIPDTIPGQGVLFFLMGETTVENAVSAQPNMMPTDITISASQRVNIRSGAGRNFNPLGRAEPNSVWTATGINEDFTWVRIAFGDTNGWVSRDLITPIDETAFNLLPVVTTEMRSPMQAFYFTTGTGNPTCRQAPDALVIQSPERLSVNLSINGATVRIGSTIVLLTQQGEDDANDDLPDACRRTEAIVLDGALDVNQNKLRIPVGHSAYFTACVDDGNIIPQDNWQDAGRVDQERLQEFAILETLPDGFLHYPIRIPTLPDIEQSEQRNVIPPASPTDDDDDNDDNNDDALGGINCSTFVAVSPLDAIVWGVQEFRWTALNGVSFFYLTLERTDNLPGLVFISQVGGTAQSIFVDVGLGALYQVGRALNLKWRAEAWALDQNGQAYPACQTAEIPVRRIVPSFTSICSQLNGIVVGGLCYRNDTVGTQIIIPD